MSGFIERLKQHKTRERAALERNRLDAKAAAEQSEIKRRRENLARQNALTDSIVPELSRQLSEAITGNPEQLFEGVDGHLEVWVRKEHYIVIDGQIDGSVVVGQTRLRSDDKINPIKVEKALERAYNNPTYINTDQSISY
jgi:hypothetical protein